MLLSYQVFAWAWHGSNIYECRTPDVLHEILKGVFDHITSWWHEMLNPRALALYEERFVGVPCYGGMKMFTKALTQLAQLNGHDMEEVMRV